MNSDSGRPPIPLWLLASPYVLSFAALMFTSRTVRKAMFLPIASLVIRITTIGMPAGACPIASALVLQRFTMCDLLLLTDSHAELHLVGQSAPSAGSLPLFARAKWVVHLLTSPRLIGWTNEPTTGALPPRPTETSRMRFAATQIAYLALHLLTMNVLGISMRLSPSFSRDGPGLAGGGWGRRSVDVLQYYGVVWSAISIPHRVAVLVLLGTGRWMPCDLPPMFAPLGNAYTLRRFWGNMHHQTLRRVVTSHANFVSQKLLHFPRQDRFSACVQLYTAFFESGAIHHWAEYMIMPLDNFGLLACGSMKFFLLQAAGIHCEDIMISAARRMGWRVNAESARSRRALRVIGCIYVWQWFTWCVPINVDPPVRIGMIENGLRVTIIQDLCKFVGKGCYIPT
ncbi:Wax synthase domain-containing protein [Pleurotus pulmonarius]